ncbi:MAG TPA: hypothetical protein VFP34_12905 [Microlunatus sp.]|nr:hypothetical protein [Microlunatus sp.]
MEDTGWTCSDPWLTSIADCTPGRYGPLLGLAPGRNGGGLKDRLAVPSDAFRTRIEIVVIDPSGPVRVRIRAALPGVRIAVDK